MSAPDRRIAPGPRGSLLMGNLADYKRDPIDMLLRLRHQYGDVVRNRLGPFLTHALAHPDHVQYVLQENHRNYIRGRFYDNFKLFFGDGLLTTEGAFWRRHRRAVQPGFARQHLDATSASVGEATLRLVDEWRALPDGGPVDAVPAMMRLSLSALGRMVFNADISHTAEDVGPAVRFGLEAMMPQGNHNDLIPRWAPTPFNARVRRARRAIDRVIARVIDEHRQERCDPSDVISLLLAARDPETGAPMSEREVHDEVMTVFLAGHETTGSGLAWALYALAQHPAVLLQLREELQGRLGGRPPLASELETMPYLSQVVDEVLRVYPPIWGYTRDLVEDDEIGGFHIPAGSSIFVSPYVTHRHPDFWPNPEAFDPCNFAGDAAAKRHKYSFLPFGGGMRKCIGYQMALHIMRIVVATVVQHLDLSCVPGHPIRRGALVALRPLDGILLRVRPQTRPPSGGPPPSPETLPEPAPAVTPPAGCPMHATPVCSPAATAPDLLPADPAVPADAGSALRFTWFPVEISPPPPMAAAALAGKRIVVVNGRPGSAERVVHALARGCAHAHVFAPAADADLAAAAAALVQRLGSIDGVVDLGLEADFTLAAADAWEAPMRRTLALMQACYDDWLAEDSAVRRFYLAVTWMDGRMGYGGGGAAAGQPLGGLWAGFAKTLPQELPNCNVRILDLDRDEAANAGLRVAAELYRWGLFEIGYSAGRRYTLQAQRCDLPAAPTAATTLGDGDVVLFSGGARGIGLLCAKAIPRHLGARVVITGREPPAGPGDSWAMLDEADFKQYCQEQLRAATPERAVAAIRNELARLRRRRALRATLDAIAADGLPIEYRVCDVTDAGAVRALCEEFGAALKIVIHNAGTDRPVRLGQKTADSFIDTVRTKVMGFAHLCAAVADNPGLVQFCNVGSLTGRWGGMTGETDYAAANEALARLGLWAQHNALRCTVKTLAWPTWDGVGMITNLQVTKQYVAVMALADGVRHWLAELADTQSGEVMFMGAVGNAVTPIQIRGFSPVFGLPNIDQLVTRHHHVGEPENFRPFERLVTRYRIDAAHAPFLQAFRLDGQPSLPAAILIEHACGAGAWMVPDPVRRMVLTGLAGLRVDLEAAILPADAGESVELRSEVSGSWSGSEWRVAVRCTLAATGREMLRLVLIHREGPALAPGERLDAVAASGPVVTLPNTAVERAQWNEHLLPEAEWRLAADGRATPRVCYLAPWVAADLWALPHPPVLRLPVAHIETVLRACWAARPARDAMAPAVWCVEQVALGSGDPAAANAVVERGPGHFAITDAAGLILMDMTGVTMAPGHAEPRRQSIRQVEPVL